MNNVVPFPGTSAPQLPQETVSEELLLFFSAKFLSSKNRANYTWNLIPNDTGFTATIRGIKKWEKHGFARIYVEVVVHAVREFHGVETVTAYYDCSKETWGTKEAGIVPKLVQLHLSQLDLKEN